MNSYQPQPARHACRAEALSEGWSAALATPRGCLQGQLTFFRRFATYGTLNLMKRRMKSSILSTFSLLCARTDEEAMCRVKRHDDHSEFARLMKRWEEPIRRLCTRMLGDAHRGEDLKQDTFLRLFEKRKAYEPSGNFSTF